jgi:hypothetical protein
MKLNLICGATLAAFVAFSALAQTRSGSIIRSDPGMSAPSTGTSADSAGSAGTTAPRSAGSAAETSVGASGAMSAPAATDRTSGLCDALTGDERMKCLREQAATGTSGSGSTGMGSGAGGGASAGGGATPGTGSR